MKWASDKRRKPGAGKTIFSKVLTGYIAVTLLIVLLTGLVSYLLVRQYLIESNLGELSVKAQTVAEMFARPGGKTRFLSI